MTGIQESRSHGSHHVWQNKCCVDDDNHQNCKIKGDSKGQQEQEQSCASHHGGHCKCDRASDLQNIRFSTPAQLKYKVTTGNQKSCGQRQGQRSGSHRNAYAAPGGRPQPTFEEHAA